MKAPNPALCGHRPDAYRNGVNRYEFQREASSSRTRPTVPEFRDEDLPAYEETPLLATSSQKSPPKFDSPPEIRRRWYQPPPDLPFSNHDSNPRNVGTYFPDYSTDAETLRQMIYEQASYPPTYYVEFKGTHTETTYRRTRHGAHPGHGNHHQRNDTETERTEIIDFFIRINITHLLSTGPEIGGELKLLADNEKGYRGGATKRLAPSVGSVNIANQHEELKAWCDKFVADPSHLKSFSLKRKVSNHDTKKVEGLIRSAIASTNYRGQVSICFPITHEKVIVYSPTRINQWRLTKWIRWLFYLTFLWIISWLYLWLATARYEVVEVVFPYADVSPEDAMFGTARNATVMDEMTWFQLWERAIKRGVISRLNCERSDMNDEYRLTTDNLAASGSDIYENFYTGNRSFGGLTGLFGGGGRFTGRGQEQLRAAWGYDC